MTAQTATIADFLLARIAEDEGGAMEAINLAVIYDQPKWHWIVAHDDGSRWQQTNATPQRVLAECEAKRRIVELHKSWPVLVETQPEFAAADPADPSSVVYRMSQQIAWTTEQHYRERFGEEPPTAPTLRALAQPYADHEEFQEAWRV